MSGAPGLALLLGGDPVTAARGLLGVLLVSDAGGEATALEVTEAEAYGGTDDPASHAYRGPTSRNASMFAPPGTLYVYRSYGIHWCANVVTGPEGSPSAVLVRGGRIVAGRQTAERRRARHDHLADGPGKVAQALGITGGHDGIDLLDPSSEVRLEGAPGRVGTGVLATPRVGISRATRRRWRFLVPETPGPDSPRE